MTRAPGQPCRCGVSPPTLRLRPRSSGQVSRSGSIPRTRSMVRCSSDSAKIRWRPRARGVGSSRQRTAEAWIRQTRAQRENRSAHEVRIHHIGGSRLALLGATLAFAQPHRRQPSRLAAGRGHRAGRRRRVVGVASARDGGPDRDRAAVRPVRGRAVDQPQVPEPVKWVAPVVRTEQVDGIRPACEKGSAAGLEVAQHPVEEL